MSGRRQAADLGAFGYRAAPWPRSFWTYARVEPTAALSSATPASFWGLRGDPERMRGPDVAYIDRTKVEAHRDPERLLRCAPDLAIEIDLASARKPGGKQRIAEYLEAGARLVWPIDPHTRTATVHRPDGSVQLVREHETLDGEDVVPGFRLRLADLFAR